MEITPERAGPGIVIGGAKKCSSVVVSGEVIQPIKTVFNHGNCVLVMPDPPSNCEVFPTAFVRSRIVPYTVNVDFI